MSSVLDEMVSRARVVSGDDGLGLAGLGDEAPVVVGEVGGHCYQGSSDVSRPGCGVQGAAVAETAVQNASFSGQ